MTTPVPLQFTPKLPYEMPFTVIGENCKKNENTPDSMYASSEFDMEPLLVDQKTELWQEQCMNQEPIYKHLQSLEAEKLQYTKKRNTCPAPAAKRIYQPRNFQTLWCPNESCPGMAKQSPEILTAGYQIIYSFILKGERLC